MAKSMTGFGIGECTSEEYSISVEIKTVNHKYLDINTRLPKKISFLEDKIRSKIKNFISRGRVEVFIKFDTIKSSGVELRYDRGLAEQYYKILTTIKSDFNIDKTIGYEEIVSFPDVITMVEQKEDEDVLWNNLKLALDKALEQLSTMRSIEGEKLKSDIIFRSEILESRMLEIEKKSENIVSEQREKLESRLSDILKDIEIDENRLAQELAIFADKSNTTEEIVRFKSHIIQLRDTVCMEEPIGRKIDFLLQEMNREVNTIGSKTSNLDITNLVIEIKSELEKIREQIQNIE